MEFYSYALLTLSVVLMAMAIVALSLVKPRRDAERVYARLGASPASARVRVPGPVERLFLRSGLADQRVHGYFILVIWSLAALLGMLFAGVPGAVLGIVLGLGLVYGLIEVQGRRRTRQIVSQLPGFVEHVSRGLQAGRTLTIAMWAAAEETRPPLQDVMRRVRREVELGGSLGEALHEAAEIHRLDSLRLVALGVRFNLRYGGSARDLMDQVVWALRRRERAYRQLKALTGETRISAVVLGVLPVGIAAYTVAMNPDYYATLLETPQGPWVLGGAVVWQALGVLFLWRMMRSL
ncbi:type II secretion system F family protein [Thioalkalivibrio sp. ALE28]|uniref:type II secretion system F family protein n=1 Tax=Thioalkalivibrio sp. ALE28 TaxID=1158179 RepID=UPI000368DE7E|nr:type II secretion system F family protein [Thioalkalivibrio sp. ALE28]